MDEAEFLIATESGPQPSRPHRLARWLRWIIAGNPFYPLSAALLLFGINRLSVDPAFLPREEAKLLFNFSALEIYEILLVWVAILLARRRIHYDSTLLIVIENGLVFVPFILVTQAVLIGRDIAALFCGAAAILAGIRFTLARRTHVLLPWRLLVLGGLVLLFNLCLPFAFRSRMELDAADWLLPGRFSWLFVLPLLVLAGNLLEQPRQWSGEPHRQTWLPLLMLGLWIMATAVHLRCIDYISSLPFQVSLLAPSIWAACWTANYRVHDFTIAPSRKVSASLLAAPAIVPLLDYEMGVTWLVLGAANVLLYGMIFLRTQSRLAWQMVMVALALLIAGAPEAVGRHVIEDFSHAKFLLAAGVFYLIAQSLLSCRPAMGLAGALALALLPGFLLRDYSFLHLAIQFGAAFLLLHSFRWDQPAEPGAAQLRNFAATLWTLHSVCWTWTDPDAFRVVCVASSLILGAAGISRWLTGSWGPWLVPVGAAISLLAAPCHYLVDKAKSSPTGLLALIGSFLLFGLGTVAALTRSSWNHSVSRIDK